MTDARPPICCCLRSVKLILLTSGTLSCLPPIVSASSAGNGCVAESTYTFTGSPDTAFVVLPNRAFGQPAFATDSLLAGVTVWLPPGQAGVLGFRLHLFVTATDSQGVPVPTNVILNGP